MKSARVGALLVAATSWLISAPATAQTDVEVGQIIGRAIAAGVVL
jgi:hypothetical protein